MIIVSACLAGRRCRYDGNDFPHNFTELMKRLVDLGTAVAVCPEEAGGLPTPRTPAELIDGRVVDKEGRDLTDAYLAGCRKILSSLEGQELDFAFLKSRSPSCGLHSVYDGTFSGRLIPGSGVFASALQKAFPQLPCFDETGTIPLPGLFPPADRN